MHAVRMLDLIASRMFETTCLYPILLETKMRSKKGAFVTVYLAELTFMGTENRSNKIIARISRIFPIVDVNSIRVH